MVGAVGQLLTMAAVAALSASTVQDVGASSVDYGFTLEESLPVGRSLASESQSSWELRPICRVPNLGTMLEIWLAF